MQTPDYLLVMAAPLMLLLLWLAGTADDRRYRNEIAYLKASGYRGTLAERWAPRPAPEQTPLDPTFATPGPAQWAAIAQRPATGPARPLFENPPTPVHRPTPATLLAQVAESLDAWDRRRRQVVVGAWPEPEAPPPQLVEPFQLLA